MKLTNLEDYKVGDIVYKIYVCKITGAIGAVSKEVVTSISYDDEILKNIIIGTREYGDDNEQYEYYCHAPVKFKNIPIYSGRNLSDKFNLVNYYILARGKKELRYILWHHPFMQIKHNIKSFFRYYFKHEKTFCNH